MAIWSALMIAKLRIIGDNIYNKYGWSKWVYSKSSELSILRKSVKHSSTYQTTSLSGSYND